MPRSVPLGCGIALRRIFRPRRKVRGRGGGGEVCISRPFPSTGVFLHSLAVLSGLPPRTPKTPRESRAPEGENGGVNFGAWCDDGTTRRHHRAMTNRSHFRVALGGDDDDDDSSSSRTERETSELERETDQMLLGCLCAIHCSLFAFVLEISHLCWLIEYN